MATWNMQQYDAAVNDAQRTLDNQYRRQQAEFDQNYKRSEQQRLIDNEMYRRKVAAEQLKHDRERQAIRDQWAKQDRDLNYGARLRADELAKIQHEYQKQNLAKNQELADLIRKNQTNAQNDIALRREFANRPHNPEAQAYMKILAGVPLSKAEKTMLEAYHPFRYDFDNGDIDGENMPVLPIEDYIRMQYKHNKNQDYFKGVNESYFPLIREQYTKNAPALKHLEREEEYKQLTPEAIGLVNQKLNAKNIKYDSKRSEELVNAAINLFRNKNGSITLKQAVDHVFGDDDNKPATPEETLFRLHGTKYTDLSNDQKEKLLYAYGEYNKKRAELYSQIGKDDYQKEYAALLQLENFWQTAMDKAKIKGITSPFHGRFSQLDAAAVL